MPAGFLVGMAVGWILTFRVSMANFADRLTFMVGVGLCGAVIGGAPKLVLRRRGRPIQWAA